LIFIPTPKLKGTKQTKARNGALILTICPQNGAFITGCLFPVPTFPPRHKAKRQRKNPNERERLMKAKKGTIQKLQKIQGTQVTQFFLVRKWKG